MRNTKNRFVAILMAIAIALLIPSISQAGGHKGHSKDYCTDCDRDSHGKIKRSPKAKHDFRKDHPCPSTGKKTGKCPGYVIDHKKALKHGGKDELSNMQWQTVEDAKAKDKWE
jgi:hypothetical protein